MRSELRSELKNQNSCTHYLSSPNLQKFLLVVPVELVSLVVLHRRIQPITPYYLPLPDFLPHEISFDTSHQADRSLPAHSLPVQGRRRTRSK